MKKYFTLLLLLLAAAPLTVLAQKGCCFFSERDPLGGPTTLSCRDVSEKKDCTFFEQFAPGEICDRSDPQFQVCVKPPKVEEIPLKFEPKKPTLQIKIPTLKPFTDVPAKTDIEGNVYLPFLGEYLAAIYQYAVSIVGLIAAVFIIKGGFGYITSGGSADKVTSAKEDIFNALIALFLVLGSYTLFYFIDPELVQFKYLRVAVIQPVSIDWDVDAESVAARPDTLPDKKPGGLALLTDTSETFGTKVRECAAWATRKIAQMCGKETALSAATGNAWDMAAKYFKRSGGTGFKFDTLDGIKNGDLVFMTSVGGTAWGPDAVSYTDEGYTRVVTSSKTLITEGLPPVTHVGIYYEGKIYNRYSGGAIAAFDAKDIQKKELKLMNRGALIKGNYVRIKNTGLEVKQWEYIAGYGTYDKSACQ